MSSAREVIDTKLRLTRDAERAAEEDLTQAQRSLDRIRERRSTLEEVAKLLAEDETP